MIMHYVNTWNDDVHDLRYLNLNAFLVSFCHLLVRVVIFILREILIWWIQCLLSFIISVIKASSLELWGVWLLKSLAHLLLVLLQSHPWTLKPSLKILHLILQSIVICKRLLCQQLIRINFVRFKLKFYRSLILIKPLAHVVALPLYLWTPWVRKICVMLLIESLKLLTLVLFMWTKNRCLSKLPQSL